MSDQAEVGPKYGARMMKTLPSDIDYRYVTTRRTTGAITVRVTTRPPPILNKTT